MVNRQRLNEYHFSMNFGISRRMKWELLGHHSADEILSLPEEEIKKYLSSRDWNYFKRYKMQYNIEETRSLFSKMEKKQIHFLYHSDAQYPKRLKNIPDKPVGVLYKGNLPQFEKSVAIVGARTSTSYGKEMAFYFAKELAKAGVAIISGLATGIDVAAHRGALEAGGVTFAVLGCGPDIVYPKENYYVYEKIQERGGIISEYNLGVEPKAWQFPERNRIISGLSDGVLVVEAKEKSGSLITADLALEQGKDVFAIPGRVLDSYSEGCNWLIRQGAQLVTEPGQILEELYSLHRKNEKDLRKSDNLLDNKEKIVYDCLGLEPKSVEDIISETNLTVSECISILFRLELNNYVKQTAKNYYIICL